MSKRKPSDEIAECQKRPRTDCQRSPSLKPVAKTSRVTGFTMRISNIPCSITEDQFLKVLNGLPYDIGPGTQRQNVLRSSFTPSAASADAQKYRTATVTFESTPLEFSSTSMPTDLFGNTTLDSHFYGLTPLHNPAEPLVDIVAVTGLAGHAFGSWKSRGGYTMWLRDFLPDNVPNARILTYGYDSTLSWNSSNASILEFSQNFLKALGTARATNAEKYRPIIFIGHSLGGLVIKHALLAAQSGNNDENKFTISPFHALLLFGVPHRGLKVAALRSIVKDQPNSRLIEDLNESSNFLRLLDQVWKSSKPTGTRVVSIYETKPTPTVQKTSTGWKRTGPEVLMVSRDSAICATPEENSNDIFSIDANHSDIVRFDNNTCQDYLNVRSKILSLVEDAQKKLKGMEMYTPIWGRDGVKQRNKILKWVSEVEYGKHHQNAKEGLLENTGQWLLGKQEFHSWRFSKDSGILWLHGIPGAGKTKLMCMVIEILKPQHKNREDRPEPVVYFYCDRNEPLRQDPTVIMQAIVKQLSVAQPDLPGVPKKVVAEYNKRVRDGFASGSLSFKESQELVVSLLDMFTQTTIIIDALDESDPKKRWLLLRALKTIIQSSANLVKILVSSRDDIDITLELSDVPNLYIDAKDNDGDIERFVYRELERSIENRRLLWGHVTNELRDQIISSIVAKAKGMFQWANLQINYLCGMRFEEDIKENLGGLPETLEEAYSQIYNTILSETPRAQRVTTKALMWVMCSRKLFTREVWAEASYWPGHAPQNSIYNLFTLCRNLVTWDSQSNAVRFTHLSVREYLERKFTSADANSMAAEDCLSLFDPTHWSGVEGHSLPRKEFIKYSTIYWPDHVESSYDDKHLMNKDLLQLLQRFLGTTTEPGQAYCKWFQQAELFVASSTPKVRQRSTIQQKKTEQRWATEQQKVTNYLDHLKSTPPNPLFAASYFRFGEELRQQWECDSLDINCANIFGETLLFVASMQGNELVVDFLLEKGADVNAGKSQFGRNPLVAAIRKGRGRTVAQLLEKGAGRHTNVLEITAYEGSGQMMELVLDRDPNTEITDRIVMAAMANKLNGTKVMEVLLDRDPNIEITERTAAMVLAASYWKYSGVGTLKLLLDRSLNIKTIEKIMVVAAGGSKGETVKKILLDIGLNIKITDAVMVAAASNKFHGKEVMKMLLDRDPSVKITDAVMVAAAGNKFHVKEVIKILLDRDPSVKITNAVMVAAAGNQFHGKEVMKVLLDRDPSVKITDAVMAAAAGNQWHAKEVIEMLLDRDPSVKITDAVMVAIAGNQWYGKQLKVLLDRDPNVKVTDAVMAAAAGNQFHGGEMIKVLLDRNPSVKITDAVMVAAAGNQWHAKEVIEMLLDRDPSVKIADAVMVAVAGNQRYGKELTKVLLDRDPNAKVTDAVMAAAAGNQCHGKEVIKMLLDRDPSVKITDAALVAAADNLWGAKEVIEMLLDRDPSVKITDAVMVAAASNQRYGKEVTKVLLDRDPSVKITDAVMVAAAGGQRYGKEVIEVLLDKDPNVKITDAVMVAAADNLWHAKEVIKVLLDRDPNAKVTDAVMVAAAGNQRYGKELIEALLDRDPSVKITDTVMVAAANNLWNAKEVIEVLLDRDPSVKITDAVMMAAASNKRYGKELTKVLLDRDPSVKVTDAVVVAAAGN